MPEWKVFYFDPYFTEVCIPEGPFDDISALGFLLKVISWRQEGDKPLSNPMLTQVSDATWGY